MAIINQKRVRSGLLHRAFRRDKPPAERVE